MMSTFDGVVEEFPNIRIDNFRYRPDRPSPAVCFLSHVHSDHLQGLESLKMPFVYCSAATKRMLLKMEKYPHRINLAKGILEARKQTYKHLKLLLRALPLRTPVELELGPKSKIQVTLFDANHCPGSVMFLIEGDRKAILYTGDIRAEPWWVNSIAREPILIPYTNGQKSLDCVYLDTTFASRNEIDKDFPSKAEGIQELLRKMADYPQNTVFYFRAWTLGYEDVWIAISNYLQSRIHVDQYQLRLFGSILEDASSSEQVAALVGYELGNQNHYGCLTLDSRVRLHSCEPGTSCFISLKEKRDVVWIAPIISRLSDGTEVAEVGAGGGGGDLYAVPCLEVRDLAAMDELQSLLSALTTDRGSIQQLQEAIDQARQDGGLNLNLEDLDLDLDADIAIQDLIQSLSNRQDIGYRIKHNVRLFRDQKVPQQKTIHFPYARHSSYNELCLFISVFHPQDICACTVEIETWSEDMSMETLFGDLCTGSVFKHDQAIRSEARGKRVLSKNEHASNMNPEEDSQETDSQRTSTPSQELQNHSSPVRDKTNTEIGEIDPRHTKSPRSRLRDVWRSSNNDSDVYQRSPSEDSQYPQNTAICEGDSDFVEGILDSAAGMDWQKLELAYKAAICCLNSGDSSEWNDLRLRSLAWVGHTLEETEL